MSTHHEHPHDLAVGQVPNRLPAAVVRELSTIEPAKALGAIAVEWALVIGAVWAALTWWHPLTIAAAAVFIGARQHAFTVIAHDAAHFRLLPGKAANDLVADVLLAWPVFITVGGFRKFHKPHHRFVNREGDGNRVLWKTHDDDALRSEWTYPKSKGALIAKLARRTALITGVRWVLRGFLAPFFLETTWAYRVARYAYYAVGAVALTWLDAWLEFTLLWLLPLCTWHVTIQYLRLVFEHSAVRTDDPRYVDTRSTLPGFVGRLLVLPRHIGYHIEHHWYPSVPFYNLPALHAELMKDPDFATHANVNRSIAASFAQVTTQPGQA